MGSHPSHTDSSFDGYEQRPCPNCGHQEHHWPIEYTEDMVVDCSECGYVFVKHPKNMDVTEFNYDE